ncbi:TetR family transcriptional regulator [Kineosporia mesophila]|uniref:TetR family transcriptional regulator n=1 Tax=Kineosporia mesophila TaxID=566012 RepID=A0ABP6Z870_9ACTN|nr:TetR/AcrR family transcriptional regulator [Kineosporia mesophila]MCD5353047.1 TetR/AcrR family transcriptional regulator [Kineosporia mesophila]
MPVVSEPRERLLRTAAGLFYSEGIGRVGIDRLVSEGQVTRATFYRHFPSKDDLVVAYLRAEDQKLRTGLAGLTDRALSPADSLRAIAHGIGDGICRPGFRGCPFINAAAEYPDPEHPVRQVVSEHRAWFLDTVMAIIGQISPGEAEIAGRQFVMMRDGAMVAGYTEQPEVAVRSLHEGTERLLSQLAR